MVQLIWEEQIQPFTTIFRDLNKRKLDAKANIQDNKTTKYHFEA